MFSLDTECSLPLNESQYKEPTATSLDIKRALTETSIMVDLNVWLAIGALLTPSFQQQSARVDLGYEVHEGYLNVRKYMQHLSIANIDSLLPACTSLATFVLPSLLLVSFDLQRLYLPLARAARSKTAALRLFVHKRMRTGDSSRSSSLSM